MLVILPLCFFLLTVLTLARRSGELSPSTRWRESILVSAMVWGVVVTVITETLSFLELLALPWTVASWAVASSAALLAAVRYRAPFPRLPNPNHAPRLMLVPLCGVALMAAVIGTIAVLSPPNGYDAMSYHMPRVMYWIENGSVAHFPTHVTRQLSMNPWAEFAITHVHLLSGGDLLVNLVQWFAMLLSLVGVSLIAQDLGATSRGQIFAVVVAATIPLGILQASSAQNDYVVTFWLLCFVHYSLVTLKRGVATGRALLIGTSLGLAILTKGTTYLFAPPFILWYLIVVAKRPHFSRWRPLLLVAPVILLLNGPYWARNYEVFGDPLGGHPGAKNTLFTPPALASGVVRNASLHLGTPSDEVNWFLNEAILLAHDRLGISPVDLRTTWLLDAFRLPRWTTSEYSASNVTTLAMLSLAIVLCFTLPRFRNDRYLVIYLVSIVGAFILFSCMVRFFVMSGRLHLPLFVLAAPFIGRVFDDVLHPTLVALLGAVLVVTSYPWLLSNTFRPAMGDLNIFSVARNDLYFFRIRGFREQIYGGVDALEAVGCDRLGLIVAPEFWEYPLHVLASSRSPTFRIAHVDVRNITSRARPLKDFQPCAILTIGTGELRDALRKYGAYDLVWKACREQFSHLVNCRYLRQGPGEKERLRVDGNLFERKRQHGSLSLFVREDYGRAARPPNNGSSPAVSIEAVRND
jgi:hypothetical protein